MKLYSWDISPYSARVRMQIYAKGLTHIANDQTPFLLTQKFYEERPLSRIPSLETDDGHAIPESAVIAEYLEEMYPEPSLLGSSPSENAHIRLLARIGDLYLINTAFTLASLTRTLAAQKPDPWAAAGSVDTNLSFSSRFKLCRADVAQRRVSPSRVVEPLDVVEHV